MDKFKVEYCCCIPDRVVASLANPFGAGASFHNKTELLWPENIVPYTIDLSLIIKVNDDNVQFKDLLKEAICRFHQKTNLIFIPRNI